MSNKTQLTEFPESKSDIPLFLWHSQRSGFSQGQSPSQIRGKGSSGLFTTLSTHTCVCLHLLAIKLAKVFKISHHNRPIITLKCC